MHEDLARYLDWLGAHGVSFELSTSLAKLPDHDRDLVRGNGAIRELTIGDLDPILEHRDTAAGLSADHATAMVASCLPCSEVQLRGRNVWDVGCGTGVLMVVAARLGAARVYGTDVDPRTLDLARGTLQDSGVEGELFECSLFDTVPHDHPMDVLLANLPHKPCPTGHTLPIAQRGGLDGVDPHAALVGCARERLRPGGQIVFFLHSLPHPRLLQTYAQACDLTLLGWKRRFLQPGEYGPLRAVFEERARTGDSFMLEADGRSFLVAGTWVATVR